MSLFYSDDELCELTGSRFPSKQIKWLKQNNIRFIVNKAKKPVVFKRPTEDDNSEDDDGLLTRKQILRRSKPVKSVCGIYFLVCGSEIMYVGQSKNLIERVGNHLRNDSILFDSFFYIEASRENLSELERRYIQKLKPRMNVQQFKKGTFIPLCGNFVSDTIAEHSK